MEEVDRDDLIFRGIEHAQLSNFKQKMEDVHHPGKENSNPWPLLPEI